MDHASRLVIQAAAPSVSYVEGDPPLSLAVVTKMLERLRAYAAHDDPTTAAANLVAIVVAANGPFYPLYVVAQLGGAGLPAFITMLASPFFAAVPWIARRSGVAGRLALPLIGTLDTFWCVKLFGPAAGMVLFALPCVVLAALLHRPGETWLRLALLAVAIAPVLLPGSIYGPPLISLSPDQAAGFAVINLISVAMLLGLIALQFATVLRNSGPAAAREP